MILVVLSILVALLLGFGAAQEFVVRGVQGGEIQPGLVGLIGIGVSILIATAGIAWWSRWTSARKMVIAAGLSSLLFHVIAALPPHRYVGILALLIGAGFGLVLLCEGVISKPRNAPVN